MSKGLEPTARNQSRCSIPIFLTLDLTIRSGSQAGPFAGLSTSCLHPLNTCTRLVPRSRSRMSVCPRDAAFSRTSGLLARKDVVRILAALLQDEVFLVAHFGFLRCVNFRPEYNRFRNEALISAPCGPFCRRRYPIIDPDRHRQGSCADHTIQASHLLDHSASDVPSVSSSMRAIRSWSPNSNVTSDTPSIMAMRSRTSRSCPGEVETRTKAIATSPSARAFK